MELIAWGIAILFGVVGLWYIGEVPEDAAVEVKEPIHLPLRNGTRK